MSRNYYDFGPIGKRIKTAREKKGLTQEQLAEILGVTPNHISEIERGISGLSIPSLMGINQHLDISADYILYGRLIEDSSNPIHAKLKELSPSQTLAVEKMIEIFADYCKQETGRKD